MARLNPDCPKCNSSLHSVYTRKKQCYATLHNNYYCPKCKSLYQINIKEAKQQAIESEKVFELLKRRLGKEKMEYFEKIYSETEKELEEA
jgi:transposase-like protein